MLFLFAFAILSAPVVTIAYIIYSVEKDWWTSELTQLRDQSIAIQQLWLSEGRPRQGPTYLERLRVRAAYKHAIRLAKKGPKQAAWNRLHTACHGSGYILSGSVGGLFTVKINPKFLQ